MFPYVFAFLLLFFHTGSAHGPRCSQFQAVSFVHRLVILWPFQLAVITVGADVDCINCICLSFWYKETQAEMAAAILHLNCIRYLVFQMFYLFLKSTPYNQCFQFGF